MTTTTTLICTFAKLQNDDWGARCVGFLPEPGESIGITKRDGTVVERHVERVVWSGPDQASSSTIVALVSLEPMTRRAPKGRRSGRTPVPPAPQAAPPQAAPSVAQGAPEPTVAARVAAVANRVSSALEALRALPKVGTDEERAGLDEALCRVGETLDRLADRCERAAVRAEDERRENARAEAERRAEREAIERDARTVAALDDAEETFDF
jgi:hypothetical protein